MSNEASNWRPSCRKKFLSRLGWWPARRAGVADWSSPWIGNDVTRYIGVHCFFLAYNFFPILPLSRFCQLCVYYLLDMVMVMAAMVGLTPLMLSLFLGFRRWSLLYCNLYQYLSLRMQSLNPLWSADVPYHGPVLFPLDWNRWSENL